MVKPLVQMGLALMALGGLLAVLGLFLGSFGKDGKLLPGDIVISWPGFTFSFPVISA
jgi:hypothetical protein